MAEETQLLSDAQRCQNSKIAKAARKAAEENEGLLKEIRELRDQVDKKKANQVKKQKRQQNKQKVKQGVDANAEEQAHLQQARQQKADKDMFRHRKHPFIRFLIERRS